MTISRSKSTTLCLTASALLWGCDALLQEEPAVCNGNVIRGIAANVRTADGRPAARGATLKIEGGDHHELIGPTVGDTLQLSGGDQPGTFWVTISKPYYRPVTRIVRVPAGPCGVAATVSIDATLQLGPKAPPVRSIVVASNTGLVVPGIEVDMHAYVDAAPDVDTSVSWSISDTTVATITTSGRVRSQCRTTRGTATVTATAVADPTRSASVWVEVWASPDRC